MTNIIKKTKEIITGESHPITCEEARMLAITGTKCTTDQRISGFIREVDELISSKARYSKFRCLVEIPSDLIKYTDSIKENFASRGFSIYSQPEINDMFVLCWQ